MRKLLEEAAKMLGTLLGPIVEIRQGEIQELKDRITAALATPEPDAMEIADKIRIILVDKREERDMHGVECRDCWDEFYAPEIASLIESHSKRVPRTMLDDAAEIEAGLVAYYGEYTKLTDATKKAIAAKYGYRAE